MQGVQGHCTPMTPDPTSPGLGDMPRSINTWEQGGLVWPCLGREAPEKGPLPPGLVLSGYHPVVQGGCQNCIWIYGLGRG